MINNFLWLKETIHKEKKKRNQSKRVLNRLKRALEKIKRSEADRVGFEPTELFRVLLISFVVFKSNITYFTLFHLILLNQKGGGEGT